MTKAIKNEDFITTTYQKILKRNHDNEGYKYWLTELNNKNINRDNMVLCFFNCKESKELYADFLGMAINESTPSSDHNSIALSNLI